jgi:RNA polymerase sigma-70 factor, ECF subfamily
MPIAFRRRAIRIPIIGRSFPADGLLAKPWPEALKAALAALPDPWRRIVILRDVEGRPPAEVSAMNGLTAEQQRDVLNRARELLREELSAVLERDGRRS